MSSSEMNNTIKHIIGYVLVFTVIIITTLSALLCGVVMQIYYIFEFIFNKTKEYITPKKTKEYITPKKTKDIIDETWCNISEKNIKIKNIKIKNKR